MKIRRDSTGPTGPVGFGSIMGAVGLITIVTMLSRLVGFGRWISQIAWVGTGQFANAYATANQIPTVLFEVVAGGALVGVTIPLLAGPIAKQMQGKVNQIASALLCWALLILTPFGLLLFLAAPLIATMLPIPADANPEFQHYLLTVFLQIFAFQMPLYGICVVLNGVLQAHERFLMPALGPLLNSLVVIFSYAVFGYLVQGVNSPEQISYQAILVLAGGTTAGVAAMSLPLLIPVYLCGVRLYPTLKLEKPLFKQAISLGGAGIGALLAQQFSVLVVIMVSRAYGPSVALPVYQYSQAIYMMPYAVLAVPVATAMFPRLSAAIDAEDYREFSRQCALSTKLVIIAGFLGFTLLVTEAGPLSLIFAKIRPMPGMEETLLLMAPGVVGYGLVFHLTRVMYSLKQAKVAVLASSIGWLLVSLLTFGLAWILNGGDTLTVLPMLAVIAISQTVGMVIAGLVLLISLKKQAGEEALRGVVGSSVRAMLVAIPVAGLGFWISQHLEIQNYDLGSLLLVMVILAVLCTVIFIPVLKNEYGRLKIGR